MKNKLIKREQELFKEKTDLEEKILKVDIELHLLFKKLYKLIK